MSYPFLHFMQFSEIAVKLDMDFGLKAENIEGARCVEVKWNKVESGACYVKYEVVLKSTSGRNEYSNYGYNIGEMTMCRFTTYSNVTNVQLTVTFKSTSKNFTAEVSDTTLSTPAPTPPCMTPFYSFSPALIVSFVDRFRSRSILNILSRVSFIAFLVYA